jgi:transcriptional regulator with XRE-family HTH domain
MHVIRGVAPKVLARTLVTATLPCVRREKSDRHPSEQAFVAWLREAATRRGLTQAEVAWEMGLRSPSTIQNWFQGVAMPSYVHLVALVAALHELPPELARFCPAGSDTEVEGSGRIEGTSDSGPGQPPQTTDVVQVPETQEAGRTTTDRPRPSDATGSRRRT